MRGGEGRPHGPPSLSPAHGARSSAHRQSMLESAPLALPTPDPMRFLTLPAVCWLLVSCASPTPDWHGTAYEPAAPAADFTLDDQFGRPFHLQSQAGKATLLFFGYTNCPDVCPTIVADMKWVFHQLGERAEGLPFGPLPELVKHPLHIGDD